MHFYVRQLFLPLSTQVCSTKTLLITALTTVRHKPLQKKETSAEIEDFVETHLCKLRGILRSRVLRVLCDLIKNVNPYWGGGNLTAVELSERINMAVDVYATLFTFVERNLSNSSMRGKKCINYLVNRANYDYS